MSFKGKKNIYMCKDCGHGFITLDVDEGVTPFLVKCGTEGCAGWASSFCYHAPQPLLADFKPAMEWYRPGAAELATLTGMTKQHVDGGGLITRRPGARVNDA